MSGWDIFGCTCIVIFLLSVVAVIVFTILNRVTLRYWDDEICITSIVLGISVVLILMAALGANRHDMNVAIEQNYTFYLDGELIDVNTIDPHLYQAHIDDEKHVVFLAR